MKMNWSDSDFPEGIYRVAVRKSAEKPSKNSGDMMFSIELEAVDFGRKEICADTIMLEGNARRVGKAKLKALGFTGAEPEIVAGELIGREAYVNLAAQSYTNSRGEQSSSLKPTKCDGAPFGYWPVATKPDGVREPDPEVKAFDERSGAGSLDEVPF